MSVQLLIEQLSIVQLLLLLLTLSVTLLLGGWEISGEDDETAAAAAVAAGAMGLATVVLAVNVNDESRFDASDETLMVVWSLLASGLSLSIATVEFGDDNDDGDFSLLSTKCFTVEHVDDEVEDIIFALLLVVADVAVELLLDCSILDGFWYDEW